MKLLILRVLTAMAAGITFVASGQPYPDRAVTLIVGASPGGGTDVAARFLAEPLGLALGKPVIIDNKPGANGNIGTAYVARAKPDGYTLLMQYSGGHVVNPHLFEKLTWEGKDFAPVALVAISPHVFAVRPDLNVNSLREFADLAKAEPGVLKYGSAGNGSIQHMAMEIFSQMTGGKMLHVPYKSAAPAVTDLLAGRLDVVNTTPSPLVAHIKAGKLKALAYTSSKRHPQFPDIPTSAESGLPGYEIATWFGVLAPANTPLAVVARLSREIKQIVESERFKQKLEQQGGLAVFRGPEEFKTLIDDDFRYWAKVVRTSGVKVDSQ